MKLNVYFTLSIFLLAVSLLTSAPFAIEQKPHSSSSSDFRRFGQGPTSMDLVNALIGEINQVGEIDQDADLSPYYEGAMINLEDLFGIAGPAVQARILRNAELAMGANPSNLLCVEVHKHVTQEVKKLLDILSDPICVANHPLAVMLPLPQNLRDHVAGYIRDPGNDDKAEAEQSIVMAAVVRSLDHILKNTGAIKKLLQSSKERLEVQNRQRNPRTLIGSFTICHTTTIMQVLHKFNQFLDNPEKVFFETLPAMFSGYFQLSKPYHLYASGHPVTHEMFKTFCRDRGIQPKAIVTQCTALFSLIQKLSLNRGTYRDPYIIWEGCDDQDEYSKLIMPHVDLAVLRGAREKDCTQSFISRTMTQAVKDIMGQFLRTHFFENASYFIKSGEDPLNDD